MWNGKIFCNICTIIIHTNSPFRNISICRCTFSLMQQFARLWAVLHKSHKSPILHNGLPTALHYQRSLSSSFYQSLILYSVFVSHLLCWLFILIVRANITVRGTITFCGPRLGNLSNSCWFASSVLRLLVTTTLWHIPFTQSGFSVVSMDNRYFHLINTCNFKPLSIWFDLEIITNKWQFRI